MVTVTGWGVDLNYIIPKWWLFQHQKLKKNNTCESQKWIHLPQTMHPCDLFRKKQEAKKHTKKNMEDFTVVRLLVISIVFKKMERDSTWKANKIPSLWRIPTAFPDEKKSPTSHGEPIVNSSPNPGDFLNMLVDWRGEGGYAPWEPLKINGWNHKSSCDLNLLIFQKNSNGWNRKKWTSRARIIYVNMEPEKFGFRWFSRISSFFCHFSPEKISGKCTQVNLLLRKTHGPTMRKHHPKKKNTVNNHWIDPHLRWYWIHCANLVSWK